jgi:hypothetical protein
MALEPFLCDRERTKDQHMRGRKEGRKQERDYVGKKDIV